MAKDARVVCPHCNRIIILGIEVRKPRSGFFRQKGSPSKPKMGIMQMTKKNIFSDAAAAPPMTARTPTYGMSSTGPTTEEVSENIRELPTNFSAYRSSLDLEPTVANQVGLPLVEAIVYGGFFFIGGVVVAWLFDIFTPSYKIYVLEKVSFGFVVGFVAAFFRYIGNGEFYRDVIQKVEEVTKRDINQDGYVGPPPQPTVNVTIPQPGPGVSRQLADLPGDLDSLREFSRYVVMGEITFSEQGALASGYGQKNFMKLRKIFLDRGWARWKNEEAHTEGVQLLKAGSLIIRELSRLNDEQVESDPPEEDTQYGRFAHIDY